MKMAKTFVTILLMVSVIGAGCACTSKAKDTEKTTTTTSSAEVVESETKKSESETEQTTKETTEQTTETTTEQTAEATTEQTSEVTTEETIQSEEGGKQYIGQYPYTVEITWKGGKNENRALTPEYSLYDKKSDVLETKPEVLSEKADEKGGTVYLGLPSGETEDYYLYIVSIDTDTASNCPFAEATANIYDKDGKLVDTIDMQNWAYNRGQTGVWFYGVSWFTDKGVVRMDDSSA